MNRIESTFQKLQKKKQKAMVSFIMAGDPNLKTTEELIITLEKSGVDLIELGIPCSDPVGDGPVIQKSGARALKAHTTLAKIFRFISRLRKRSQIPILLMGYYNPILQYGIKAFCHSCQGAGIDGVLVVDLPFEEKENFYQLTEQVGLSHVLLVTPECKNKRIDQVIRHSSGFVYYISHVGVTGSKTQHALNHQTSFRYLKKHCTLPVCVGFGIKTPDQAQQVAIHCDGVVVGSAIVKLLEDFHRPESLKRVQNVSKKLAQAVHSTSFS